MLVENGSLEIPSGVDSPITEGEKTQIFLISSNASNGLVAHVSNK